IRIRHKPSTSTRTVLSGNFSIFKTRAAQPTSYMSSGSGFSTSGRRCNATPNKRSPPTTSSIKWMLWAFSTSKGATIPGKITMSDSPRIGSTSGKEREEIRGGVVSPPPDVAPKMLMNSVSGEVMVASFPILDAAPPQKIQKYLLGRDDQLGVFHRSRRQYRHIHPQEAVRVRSFGLA